MKFPQLVNVDLSIIGALLPRYLINRQPCEITLID